MNSPPPDARAYNAFVALAHAPCPHDFTCAHVDDPTCADPHLSIPHTVPLCSRVCITSMYYQYFSTNTI